MNISIVYSHHLHSPHAGGVMQYIRGCIRFSPPDDRFVYWCRGADDTDPSLVMPRTTVRTYCERVKRKVIPETIRILWHIWRYRREIEQDADVIFLHESEMTLPWLFPRKRVPVVLVMHTGIEMAHLFQTRRYMILHKFTDWVASYLADDIIAVSRSSLDYYQHKFPKQADKFRYICTFADDDMLSSATPEEARRALGLPNGRRVISYAGRIHGQKKVSHIVSVFRHIVRQHPDALLCIAGDGELRCDVERQVADLGLESDVRFLGVLNRTDVGHLFRASEFSMLLSNWEGTPMALLESLAAGTPAIVSDVSDHRHIVKDGVNGFVVGNWPHEEIAGLAGEILDDAERFQEGARESGKAYLASRIAPDIVSEVHRAAAGGEAGGA